MAPSLVVLLNGTLGVGKTSVAQALLWLQPKTVLLECDALCNLNPFDAYDPVRIAALTEVLGFMVDRYRRMGYQRFVIDGIFETISEVRAVEDAVTPGDGRFVHVLLTAGADRRKANIEKRRRDNYRWELERSEELQGLLVSAFRGDPGTRFLEVSDLGVGEVVEELVRVVDSAPGGAHGQESVPD